MRQLASLLVNVPAELMYWPAEFTMATWTSSMAMVVLDPAADEDLAVGERRALGRRCRLVSSVGGRSPG